MEQATLVSIIVITYNSAKYVIETLDSAKAQTYQNIELIISDDSSTDDTISICEKWVNENKLRFNRVRVITTLKNTGIPANCNRGVSVAKGEWIKLIAGDDILDSDCIAAFIEFCQTNKNIKIVSSISQPFISEFAKTNYTVPINVNNIFYAPYITPAAQYRILLYKCVIHAPNVFISIDIIKKLDGFDEKFKLMEDYPFWLKVTKSGYKFYFLNKITVFYRIHKDSVYNNRHQHKIFNDFYLEKRIFEFAYIFPNVPKLVRLLYDFEFIRKKIFNYLGLNKDHYMLKVLYYLTYFLSPYYIYNSIKYHKLLNDQRKCAIK